MPTRPRLPILLIPLLLAGCDHKSLRQQVELERQFSAREDRMYSEQAVREVEKTYWTRRDHGWLGKLPDGSIVRLESFHATAAPLPSRAFYSGWHLQLTITSDDWRTYPASSSNSQPFQAVYAITRHGVDNWKIDVTSGPATAPLQREDVALISE
jgi:hypothetical protein